MRLFSKGNVACGILIAVQGLAIFHGQSAASRYFCWAPFDKHTQYTVEVSIPGRGALSQPEIRQRYHLFKFFYREIHHDNRSPQHVIDILRQYEETYGRAENAQVVMRYTVNGRNPQEWHWPPQ